jgi:formamidopyrimidine-DNA glycosylase
MPEGPEVLTIVTQLKPQLLDKVIVDAQIVSGRYVRHGEPEGWTVLKAQPKIVDLNCKGKFIWFTLENDWYLFNTLGMTGSWGVFEGDEQRAHERVRFQLTDGELSFMDVRNFGTLKFVRGKSSLDKKLTELGWDPLGTSCPPQTRQNVMESDRTLAEILMDQKVFAGVGNYVKAESLYRAKLSPWRKGVSISSEEFTDLCDQICDVMRESFVARGTTIRDYRDAMGEGGSFQNQLRVYGKTVDPAGNVIKRETTPDGRTTFWVPTYQK